MNSQTSVLQHERQNFYRRSDWAAEKKKEKHFNVIGELWRPSYLVHILGISKHCESKRLCRTKNLRNRGSKKHCEKKVAKNIGDKTGICGRGQNVPFPNRFSALAVCQ